MIFRLTLISMLTIYSSIGTFLVYICTACVVNFKGTAMQTEKVLINDRLHVLQVSCKLRIPTIYSFAVIYPRNLPFS